jgi:proton glutamate symport protein
VPDGLALVGVVLFSAAIVVSVFFRGHSWLAGMRWAGLSSIALGGLRRRSLTYWIFFAILFGGELGFDRPAIAEHLRFLSDIFLRLIKIIVPRRCGGTNS